MGRVCSIFRNFTKLNLLKLQLVPQSSGLKARCSSSFQPESIAEFSWCLGGQIDVENLNKLIPLNVTSLFGKKKTKKMCGTLLCQAIWCCSFLLFMYRGKWGVTGSWNRSGSSEDYDSCVALYCSVHLRATARVGVKHCTSGW